MSKIPAEISSFVHSDTDVTVDRLELFAEAERGPQQKTLAYLRENSVEDTVELTLMAIAITVLLPIAIALNPIQATDGPWIARAIAGLVIGLAGGTIFALFPGLPALLRQTRRTRATVWLRAYEDELARRHAQRGRAARRWKATH